MPTIDFRTKRLQTPTSVSNSTVGSFACELVEQQFQTRTPTIKIDTTQSCKSTSSKPVADLKSVYTLTFANIHKFTNDRIKVYHCKGLTQYILDVTSEVTLTTPTNKTVVIDLSDLSVDMTAENFIVLELNGDSATKRVFITGSFVDCVCNYSHREIINPSKNITISAKTGNEFRESFSYREGFSSYDTPTSDPLKITIGTSSLNEDIDLYDTYKSMKILDRLGGFINLYKVNDTELGLLSKARFVSIPENERFDYGQFIYNLYVLPLPLPSFVVGGRGDIILGELDTNIESTLCETYNYDIDGGSITTPLKYNNVYDFLNTECYLNVPFVGKIYINPEYVIGETIGVKLTIDLHNGMMTLRVSSSFSAYTTVHMQDVQIGMAIPFIQKDLGVVNSINSNFLNPFPRSFIEVIRNIPYTKEANIFGNAVVEYGVIGDYEGFIKCENVQLATNATKTEQDEIKSLLQVGVFI